jgi:hypothetical protein
MLLAVFSIRKTQGQEEGASCAEDAAPRLDQGGRARLRPNRVARVTRALWLTPLSFLVVPVHPRDDFDGTVVDKSFLQNRPIVQES